MRPKHVWILATLVVLGLLATVFRGTLWKTYVVAAQLVRGRSSVAERVEQYGPAAHERLAADFARIGVEPPPSAITLIGLKHERRLEVWLAEPPRLLRSYPILGASGQLGPKLREGDRQVPEGLYRIESLNPNSRFHLALRVNYPNAFDRAQADRDGREDPGSDIMIHGKDRSIGCLAMGDEAAEELFVLAAEAGVANVDVILSPVDFRVRDLPSQRGEVPEWTDELYGRIRNALARFVAR